MGIIHCCPGSKIINETKKDYYIIINFEIILRCFETNNELSYLVFEDLSEKGFANKNRQIGLSVADFRLVLAKTAKWHAATAVLHERVTTETPLKVSKH